MKDALFGRLTLRVIRRTSLFWIRYIICEFDILAWRVGIDRDSLPIIFSRSFICSITAAPAEINSSLHLQSEEEVKLYFLPISDTNSESERAFVTILAVSSFNIYEREIPHPSGMEGCYMPYYYSNKIFGDLISKSCNRYS